MNTEPRTLQDMQGKPTAYEIVVTSDLKPDYKARIGFTAKVTKMMLFEMATAFAQTMEPEDMQALIGDNALVTFTRKDGLRVGNMVISTTGRTEHTCRVEGK